MSEFFRAAAACDPKVQDHLSREEKTYVARAKFAAPGQEPQFDWNATDARLEDAREAARRRREAEYEALQWAEDAAVQADAAEDAAERQVRERVQERQRRLEELQRSPPTPADSPGSLSPGLPRSSPHVIDQLHGVARDVLLEARAETNAIDPVMRAGNVEAYLEWQRECAREAAQEAEEVAVEEELRRRQLRNSTRFT
eukprot:EG_transcript_23507